MSPQLVSSSKPCSFERSSSSVLHEPFERQPNYDNKRTELLLAACRNGDGSHHTRRCFGDFSAPVGLCWLEGEDVDCSEPCQIGISEYHMNSCKDSGD